MRSDDSGGGSRPFSFFTRHPVDGSVLCAHADGVAGTSRGFGEVADGVGKAHARAVAAVEGDVRGPTDAAVRPVLAQARDTQRAAEVGGAALMMWGVAVGAFNRGVDRRNAAIEGEKTPEERRARQDALAPLQRRAEARLDEAAGDAARILDAPLDDRSVKELWSAGFLPASTRGLFAHVDLPRGDAMRRHLATLVRRDVLPPQALAMSPDELVEHLKQDPELATRLSRLDLADLPADVPGADLQETEDPREIRQILTKFDPSDAAMLALLYSKNLRNTDGVPFDLRVLGNTVAVTAARERAHRRIKRLKPLLAAPGGHDARDEVESLTKRTALYDSILQDDRKILLFRPDAAGGDGHIAELHGTIDENTKNLAILVPGTGSDLDDIDRLTQRGRDLVDRNEARSGPTDLAAITWLGGDMPDTLLEAVRTDRSKHNAEVLAAFTHEVRDETDQRVGHHVDVTGVGHSYGGATVGLSERAGADYDRVLHVSSAGMGDGIETARDVDRLPGRPRFSLVAPGDPIDTTNGLPFNSHGADPDDHSYRLPAGRDAEGEGVRGIGAHGGVFDPTGDAFSRIYDVIDGTIGARPGERSETLIPAHPPHLMDRLPQPLLPPELGSLGARP